MFECINCGTELKPGQSTCHVCGAVTPYQKAQKVCMNCGSLAAQGVKTCMMCGHTIDALPSQAADFSVSWWGVLIGIAIVISLTYWFFQIEPATVSSATTMATPTPFFLPPTETPTPTITPTATPAPSLTPTPTATPAPVMHIIKTGESLLIIANKYGVTVEDLTAANTIASNTILRVGQQLIIPFAASIHSTETEDPRVAPVINYVVKGGDTLSGIAFEYDSSVDAIKQANPGVDLTLLSVGQEMVVPLKPPTFTPTPTLTPTPTFTPGPPFAAPYQLLPLNDALIEGDTSTVLLTWTSSGYLTGKVFYVVHLTDDTGALTTYWTQSTSYRIPAEKRPSRLTTYNWYVVVMEEIGIDENNLFYGKALSLPSPTRTFRWR